MYYAYILKGRDGRHYYGSCHDLEKRLECHNCGKVKATRYRRPFQLHYYEEFATRSEAFRREMFFKSIDGYRRPIRMRLYGKNESRNKSTSTADLHQFPPFYHTNNIHFQKWFSMFKILYYNEFSQVSTKVLFIFTLNFICLAFSLIYIHK